MIHLAAIKQLVPSTPGDANPYVVNNVNAVASLLEVMASHGAPNLIFASSSAVYSAQQKGKLIREDFEKVPRSDYGKSKLINEEAITKYANTWGVNCVSLRFFNLAGSLKPKLFDRDGTSLIPLVIKALERGEQFSVFGSNLETNDGSPVRDYVHVIDAVKAIEKSLNFLQKNQNKEQGHTIFNIGTQTGTSVLRVLGLMREITGIDLPLRFLESREGEVAEAIADASLAQKELGWLPTYSLLEIIKSDLINSNFKLG